ncbi:H-NS family nucleoid-associated regulatory protein [Roseicyclus persicicus]|uniref:H-NS histone family protein n=1 Tax=Roseicyclus persicicus TaxID=2650661 RepID=A0A7X6GVW4_9RHOB|nr:H-NS histone family protein [Roseibacterium persicicum]NKX43336.1 H-NS histone family protein [Roseibacterium persicicum]
MTKELGKMSLEELQAHQRDVEAAIKGYEKKRRADALAAAREAAKAHGFVLEDLVGGKPAAKSGTKGAAKYANPADPSQTWTGRGRQPNWVKEALAKGKSLESMAL